MSFRPMLYTVKVKGEEAKPPPHLEPLQHMPGWMPGEEADEVFKRCLSEIPFGPMKWNTTILPQLALYYDESRRKEAPVAVLEELVAKIEAAFGSTCEAVWCNLFEQGNHNIAWHQDQYGCHTLVLSFGASRDVVYREKTLISKAKELQRINASHGDLYYFAPSWDAKTEHSVPAMPHVSEKRVSIVFFVTRPKSGPS